MLYSLWNWVNNFLATFIGFPVQVLHCFGIEYTRHWSEKETPKGLELYNMSVAVNPIILFIIAI